MKPTRISASSYLNTAPLVWSFLYGQNHGKVEIIPTTSSWFGVTYKEDAPFVEKSLNDLIKKGEYPERLWVKEENVK